MLKKIAIFSIVLAAAFFSYRSLTIVSTAQEQKSKESAKVSPEVLRQIGARLKEKYNRPVAQNKISNQLLAASEQFRGLRTKDTAGVSIDKFVVNERGLVAVDIEVNAARQIIKRISQIGGEITFVSKESGFLQAYIPLEQIENLAALAEVKNITPTIKGKTQRYDAAPESLFQTSFVNNLTDAAGSVASEGDVTHRAAQARTQFDVNGSGVKIGVISDSVRFLERSQASGDLPANVTVIPGQSGILPSGGDIGEGTAMLEIIHDLAPGAQLFFATGFANGNQNPVQFANNIRALRNAGCQIIVDDLVATFGPDGTPFQDVIVGAAINDVTASGVLYFSSAGNAGNLNDGTSGVWEGDFADSGVPVTDENGNAFATLHTFGNGEISNVINAEGFGIATLWWADAVGASANDYDVFLLNAEGTAIIAGSADVQDGNDSPFEAFGLPDNAVGTQLLIARKTGAQTRALHISVDRGLLSIATAGQIRGHNGAANALSIAATPGGIFSFNVGPISPFPNPFNSSNEVERFSSDGFRRIFYNQNGQPVSRISGFTFASFGGRTLFKPDFTAADGVATTFPFPSALNPFFGTSAAAPHAAAIAALAKSAKPTASRQVIISSLRAGSIDIEATFLDRDSGNGIIDAFNAVQTARNSSSSSGSCSTTVSGGICTITRCVNGNCTTQSFPVTPTTPCSCSTP